MKHTCCHTLVAGPKVMFSTRWSSPRHSTATEEEEDEQEDYDDDDDDDDDGDDGDDDDDDDDDHDDHIMLTTYPHHGRHHLQDLRLHRHYKDLSCKQCRANTFYVAAAVAVVSTSNVACTG